VRSLDVVGIVVLLAIVAAGFIFWSRGRNLGAGGPGGWRGGRINLALGFPRTRRSGYLPADVDEVLDRAYGLSTDAEGRAEALELLHQVQFGLVSRGGYDPVVVDLHVDAMIVALQTGRELPVRPGTPRT
jgi:hypothetical protein